MDDTLTLILVIIVGVLAIDGVRRWWKGNLWKRKSR